MAAEGGGGAAASIELAPRHPGGGRSRSPEGHEGMEELQATLLQSVDQIQIFLSQSTLDELTGEPCSSEGGGSGGSGAEGQSAAAAEFRRERLFSELHAALAKAESARLLDRVLEQEWLLAAAPIVIEFLTEVALSYREGLRKTAALDLKLVLRVPSWSEKFLTSKSAQQKLKRMAPECRFLLARESADSNACSSDGERSRESIFRDQWAFLELDKDHTRKVEEKVRESMQQVRESLRQCGARIVIMGNTRVGKSSCINAAFGRSLAATGAGRSVTTHITHYEATEECPVHVYDTKGFESISDNEDVIKQLKQLLQERQAAASKYKVDDPARIAEKLHAVWWVVDVVGGGHFDPKLLTLIEEIFTEQKLPILIILNKCDCAADFVQGVQSSVMRDCPWAAGVVCVVADPRLGPLRQRCEACGSDDITVSTKRKFYNCEACGELRRPFKRSYGFDDLIRVTADQLPEMCVLSLLASQKEWLGGLDRFAVDCIVADALVAAGIGAAPLPFMSRFALVPLQFIMIGQLARIYDLLLSTKTKAHIVVSVGGICLGGGLGCLVANGLKMIPGLSAAGMISDGAISMATTAALGMLVKELFRRVRGKALAGEVRPEDLAAVMHLEEQKQFFRDYLSRIAAPFKELFSDFQNMDKEQLRAVLESAVP